MAKRLAREKGISVSQTIESGQGVDAKERVESRATEILKPSPHALAAFNLRKSYGRR